jgi:GGDEF domain-containing protein
MPLLLFLPVLVALLMPYLLTDIAAGISILFPSAVYVLLSLTTLLAVLMRQWHWLYSLSLLCSHYALVQQQLQQPLTQPDTAALIQFLPLLFTLLMLLLQHNLKPQLFSVSGIAKWLMLLLAPFCLAGLPLADWQQALPLPMAFWQPVSANLLLSWGQLWWMAVIASCWLGLLNFYSASAQRWGQFASWLAIMLFYALIQQPEMSGWMTLAACTVLLLSLSYQMLQLAYIDELTQLPQRRALLNHLSRLRRRSAVTMLDVDHFKKFNDSYGHDVGDQVLKLLGAILARETGLSAYRYGGEEFTLVFNHNNADTLADKLEQVRAKVAAYPLAIREQNRPADGKTGKQQRGNSTASKTVHVTISLGCAIRQPGESTAQLLKRADEALYKAKKAGRNQVIVAR